MATQGDSDQSLSDMCICVCVFVFVCNANFVHIFIFLHIVYLLVYPIYSFRVWQLSTRGPLAEHWFSRPVSLVCHHLICICIILHKYRRHGKENLLIDIKVWS